MERRNSGGDDGGGDSWMNTYADMVTLLLTFFAVLLSMSAVDQEKFNAFIQSFSNLPPEVIEEIVSSGAPSDVESENEPSPEEVAQAMDKLFQSLSQYVTDNDMQDSISISKNNNVVFTSFDSAMLFSPDGSEILESSLPALSFIGNGIKAYERMIRLVAVCGHTASVSESYPVDDWMLSSERAGVVASYLEKQTHFDAKKLRTIGFGKTLPIAENATEEGRAKNRRVELAIIGTTTTDEFDPYMGLIDIYGMKDYSNIENQVVQSVPETLPEDIRPNIPITSDDVQFGVSPYD
ncbi:MAG: OmpA family protein [Clostridiales bacterium]|nr:OmpA family protein [Clostridiales bacterium]